MDQQSDKRIVYLFYAFFLAASFVFLHGYQFNRGDQAEHLPQIYQRFDPELYQGDFFLTFYHMTFPVRYYWVETVYWLSVVLPLPFVCFSLLYLCLAFSIYAWMQVTAILTRNNTAPYFSALLMIIVFNSVTIGANTFAGSTYVASNPAMLCISFGFLAFFRQRYLRAGALFGVATLFQALFGLQVWLITASFLFIALSRKSFKSAVILSLAYLVCAAPMLIPILLHQTGQAATTLTDPSAYDLHDFYFTLYVQRCYLHFMPSLFPLKDYLLFGVLLLLSAFCGYRLRQPYSRAIFKLVLIILLGCHIYWLLLEIMQVEATGKLQWFKSTIWVNAFCCILLGDWISKMVWPRLQFIKVDTSGIKQGLIAATIVLLLVINNAAWLPGEKLKRRYQTGNYVKTDLQLTHDWIKANAPKNAMFLCPPSDDGFN